MSDVLDRLRLARTDGVGPITYRRLLARYGRAADAISALPDLARAGGRSSPLVVPPVATAERELERTQKLGAKLLFLNEKEYPPLLALLDDAPAVIAVLGDLAAFAPRAVALVGSRNASVNGQRIAEALAQELAEAGLTVVSGLARGIDAAAHEGALLGGRTVACVAGGIDIPYPPEHAPLQARIVASGGAIVAEMPPGTAPQSRLFIRRNRVIAGLSLGVVVVEAAVRSGALVTARIGQDAEPGTVRGARIAARPALPRRQRPDPPGRASGRGRRRRADPPARPSESRRAFAVAAVRPRPGPGGAAGRACRAARAVAGGSAAGLLGARGSVATARSLAHFG